MLGGVTTDNWRKVVEQYGSCKLTKSSDRLVAIAGLAKDLHAKTKDQYVVGMWRSSLVYDLLWKVFKPKGRVIKPSTGPSWSWASLDTYATVLSCNSYDAEEEAQRSTEEVKLIEVDGISMQLTTDDPFGSVLSATLRLRCQRFSMALLLANDFTLSTQGMLISEMWTVMETDFDTQGTYDSSPEVVYVVFILDLSHTVGGLLLLPVDDHVGQYRRIGRFTIYFDFGKSDALSFSRVVFMYEKQLNVVT